MNHNWIYLPFDFNDHWHLNITHVWQNFMLSFSLKSCSVHENLICYCCYSAKLIFLAFLRLNSFLRTRAYWMHMIWWTTTVNLSFFTFHTFADTSMISVIKLLFIELDQLYNQNQAYNSYALLELLNFLHVKIKWQLKS
jgi:hypothetical protein